MAFGTSIPMYKRVPVCQVPEQIMSGNHKSIGHKYPFKTIINILILIFVGWPVAGFAAWIYIFISPFAACLGSGCDKISDFCQKGVEWPRALGKAIKDGDSSFGC